MIGKYFIDEDNSGHYYIVPISRLSEWKEWCELDDDDERSWEAPSFTEEIGGSPTLVAFSNYEIDK